MFPISSYTGYAALEYVGYKLGEPPFDERECRNRGLSYGAPLRVTVRLVIYDRESSNKADQVREGAGGLHGRDAAHDRQRHLHRQRHRARHRLAAAPFAGRVLRPRPRQDAFSSGKLLYSARIIPYRGSWLDFEFDPKDALFTRIDRRRKLPVTVLLRALGYNNEEMLDMFFEINTFHIDPKEGVQLELVPERLRGETLNFDLADRRQGHRRSRQAHHRAPRQAARAGRRSSRARSAGRVPGRPHPVARRRRHEDRRTAGHRQRRDQRRRTSAAFRKAGIDAVGTLWVNDLDRGAVPLQHAAHRSDQDASSKRWSRSTA